MSHKSFVFTKVKNVHESPVKLFSYVVSISMVDSNELTVQYHLLTFDQLVCSVWEVFDTKEFHLN